MLGDTRQGDCTLKAYMLSSSIPFAIAFIMLGVAFSVLPGRYHRRSDDAESRFENRPMGSRRDRKAARLTNKQTSCGGVEVNG